MLDDNSKPVANPLAILREDFDDWSILFDPDLDTGFGLNAIGTFIWKRLDGQNTVQDIMAELSISCRDLPEEAEEYVKDFIQYLVDKGLAGYEIQEGWAKTDRKSGAKKGYDKMGWGIPVLMELGHRSLNNIAAFVESYLISVSGGGGCGCQACASGPQPGLACTSGGIPNTGCGCS